MQIFFFPLENQMPQKYYQMIRLPPSGGFKTFLQASRHDIIGLLMWPTTKIHTNCVSYFLLLWCHIISVGLKTNIWLCFESQWKFKLSNIPNIVFLDTKLKAFYCNTLAQKDLTCFQTALECHGSLFSNFLWLLLPCGLDRPHYMLYILGTPPPKKTPKKPHNNQKNQQRKKKPLIFHIKIFYSC